MTIEEILAGESKNVEFKEILPEKSIRELIINAMVHRSYLDHGTIQVAVYDNRLEITSPGKLPMGQTMERMKEGYSKIRNEALAHAFAYMNLIEHWATTGQMYVRMNWQFTVKFWKYRNRRIFTVLVSKPRIRKYL